MSIIRKHVYDLLDSQGNKIGSTFNQNEAVKKMYNDEIECYIAIETLYINNVRQNQYDLIDFFYTKENLVESLKTGQINVSCMCVPPERM